MTRAGERAQRREKIAEASRMRDEGKSIPAIASEMGVTSTRVVAWLKEADSFRTESDDRFIPLAHPYGGFYYVNSAQVAWFTDGDRGLTKIFMPGDPEGFIVAEPVEAVLKKLSG